MSSNIENINKIPFTSILNKLGYFENSWYKLQGNRIKMIDWWKVTGGWNGDLDRWFLKCNSGKKPWRFEGDRISMVQDKFGITKAEAITWYEEHFPNDLEKKKTFSSPTVKDEWWKLGQLSQEQITYLHSRKIKHSLIKDEVRSYMGSIALPIYSENKTMVSYQWRNIGETSKKNRYRLLPWHPAKGLFANWLTVNPDEEVFVVEGMTDYLTLRQFTTQVVGLVSKDNGIEEIKALKNRYRFILIPDEDEAWKQSLEKLSSLNLWVLSLSQYEDENIKDVNDLWITSLASWLDADMFIKMLSEDAKRPLTNIEQALEKAIRNRQNVWWKIGDKTFDWATGWITPWTTMLINWASGQGKTTIANWIMQNMLKQKKKIAFFSLETDAWKMLAQILGYHFWVNWRKEIYPKIEKYLADFWPENLKDLMLFDDVRTLDDIEHAIIENKIDIAFIDYAQIMDWLPWTVMKEKMGNYAKRVQQIARDTYTAMISLSQIPKSEEHDKPVVYRSPMEAMALKSASDTMINVWIYQGKHKIAFVKCKEWDDGAWGTEYDSDWNKDTWQIYIFKDETTSSF